eukprot:COSAG06_NODE_857_length_11918_cov_4.047551_2_plen_673_part_00
MDPENPEDQDRDQCVTAKVVSAWAPSAPPATNPLAIHGGRGSCAQLLCGFVLGALSILIGLHGDECAEPPSHQHRHDVAGPALPEPVLEFPEAHITIEPPPEPEPEVCTFEYNAEPLSFHAADTACLGNGGHLASVHSQDEQDTIAALIPDGGSGWIGFHDLLAEAGCEDLGFVWTDGSETDYTNWAEGEPNDWLAGAPHCDGSGNEDCTEQGGYGGTAWNDMDCDTVMPYVCKTCKGQPVESPPVPGSAPPLLLPTCDTISPCQNGATCATMDGVPTCLCTSGFKGPRCEQTTISCPPLPTCADITCEHGSCGVTADSVPSCFCDGGWAGHRCETAITPETVEPATCDTISPCQNGASCAAMDGAPVCLCASGFHGPRCEQTAAPCPAPAPASEVPPPEPEPEPEPEVCTFEYNAEPLSFHAADTACLGNGGHLASVHSQDEQDTIAALIPDGGSGWIGFHDLLAEAGCEDLGFVWTDGSETDYTNWAEGEPNDWLAGAPHCDGSGNEDCTEQGGYGGTAWNDMDCDTVMPYVCKVCTALAPPDNSAAAAPPSPPQVEESTLEYFDDGSGRTYEWMEASCAAKGARMCTFEELCPAGRGSPPVGGRLSGDEWIPVAPSAQYDKDWVQLGTRAEQCSLHLQHEGWGITPCCCNDWCNTEADQSWKGRYGCCT